MRRPSRLGLIPVCASGTNDRLAAASCHPVYGCAIVSLLSFPCVLAGCDDPASEIPGNPPVKNVSPEERPAAELNYFFPHTASTRDEITFVGKNFIPNATNGSHNEVSVGAKVSSDTIRFNDFSEYDPRTKKWKSVVDVPVSRHSMYSCSLDDDGYLGSGKTHRHMWYDDIPTFEVQ